MPHFAIFVITILTIAGIIIRPFKLPEATWAVAGAFLLVVLRLISPVEAIEGIGKGTDVYLFLTGMMLLSETAREEKLFDWLAAYATQLAKGSAKRLFLLIYIVGIFVTAFLSNDATAVVLTPAVASAAKAANAKQPLPFLLICAFIANAASFILPISNPANLVIYGAHIPSLLQWLPRYILPSLAAIIVTYILLFYTQRKALKQQLETPVSLPPLNRGGKLAAGGIVATAVILLLASALDIPLGLPTAVMGILTSLVVIILAKKNPRTVIRGVSWSVLPLVAGLFVIVEGLNKTGLIKTLIVLLKQSANHSIKETVWSSSTIVALACNIMNNLPAGLIAGNAVQASHLPEIINSSILIGVDLGPNLSITGSLATILWLVALRRENYTVSFWTFLKLGFLIMIPSLLLSIATLWL